MGFDCCACMELNPPQEAGKDSGSFWRKEAAGDLAGLGRGLRCSEGPLRVSLFTVNLVKLPDGGHYFLYFPLWLRPLAEKGVVALGSHAPEKCPWAASSSRKRCWFVRCSETVREAPPGAFTAPWMDFPGLTLWLPCLLGNSSPYIVCFRNDGGGDQLC